MSTRSVDDSDTVEANVMTYRGVERQMVSISVCRAPTRPVPPSKAVLRELKIAAISDDVRRGLEK